MKKFIMKALAFNENLYNQIADMHSINDYDFELTLKKKIHYYPKYDHPTMYVKDYPKRKSQNN
ncbi:hypothetical protein EDD63_15015 [Breznakia blatticola]|uniref:Uncharacterized protein n=1 Tax=Breznakia blatticola TaxID=1754012 RepID=A0A4R7ZAL0_9FIRM|nr:hypothetical protein [Breznakia blatticola]TDW13109.1 hypothetical protein EDD63_15015 [Breznakia blatticola]